MSVKLFPLEVMCGFQLKSYDVLKLKQKENGWTALFFEHSAYESLTNGMYKINCIIVYFYIYILNDPFQIFDRVRSSYLVLKFSYLQQAITKDIRRTMIMQNWKLLILRWLHRQQALLHRIDSKTHRAHCRFASNIFLSFPAEEDAGYHSVKKRQGSSVRRVVVISVWPKREIAFSPSIRYVCSILCVSL